MLLAGFARTSRFAPSIAEKTPAAIARRYEVSRSYIYQVRDRMRETGVRTSFQIGGHCRSRLEQAEPALRNWIASKPDAPRSSRGTFVILDNLSSHKVDGVKAAIAAVGASVLYLPPYSPDLNPLEKLFSKLKAAPK